MVQCRSMYKCYFEYSFATQHSINASLSIISSNSTCNPYPCIIHLIKSIKLIIWWKAPIFSSIFLRALDSSYCYLMETAFQSNGWSKVETNTILYWENFSERKCIDEKIPTGSVNFRSVIGMKNVDTQPGWWPLVTVCMLPLHKRSQGLKSHLAAHMRI